MSTTVGVVGAGTMGRGIAQLGATGGMATLLYDPVPEAIEVALDAIRKDLAQGVERGKVDEADADAALDRLTPVTGLAELQGCDIVVEAAPERLELKAEIFGQLPADAVLATNTSSLSVTAIAAHAPRPKNVVGMHFFNPPARMRLVEIVAGVQTAPAALELARATTVAMGRIPITATDDIGFLVNRCGRPYYAEALRLMDEGIADPATIDRICRIGGGFRMGPFELMDLVGIDTGLDVAESFTRQSYGEPRWKPSPAQRRLVSAGRLGRKSGHGWYGYADGPHRPEDPAVPPGNQGMGRTIAVLGHDAEAAGLRARAGAHGFSVADDIAASDVEVAFAFTAPPDTTIPLAVSCGPGTAAGIAGPGVVGFHILPPASDVALIELAGGGGPASDAGRAVASVSTALGLHAEWVEDSPALVLGRIVSQVVNEACFAVGANVGSADDIDLGLSLGLNHPHGPFAWASRIGLPGVLARIDGLWSDRHEDRYRAAPLLRRAVALGVPVSALRPAAESTGS